jgi:phosphorylcholine metabolism protein LicD
MFKKILKKLKKPFKKYKDELFDEKKVLVIKKHGLEALTIIHDTFEENNIVYWLDGGTLLGFVRDKGFIKKDQDIDIGIFYEEGILEKIYELLKSKGFNINYDFTLDGIVRESRVEYKGVGIDIMCYFEDNNGHPYMYNFNGNSVTKHLYPVEYIFDKGVFNKRIKIKINDKEFYIPKNFEKVLTSNYGDWETPILKSQGYQMFQGPNTRHYKDRIAYKNHYAKSMLKKIGYLEALFIYLKSKLM